MPNIFLNLDLKEFNTHLVHYARQIAYGREGTVLWYVPLRMPADTANLSIEQFKIRVQQEEKNYDEQMKKICLQFLDHTRATPDLECHYHIARNFSDESVAEFIGKKKINMIISTTRDENLIKKLTKSNHQNYFLKTAGFPVLFVPERSELREIKKVLFATDLNHFDLNHIKCLDSLISHLDPEITVLHVKTSTSPFSSTRYDRFRGRLKNLIPNTKISYYLIENNDITKSISSYAEYEEMDMVVMSRRSRNFVEGILFGSFTEEYIDHSPIPVFVFHHSVEFSDKHRIQ